MLGENLNLLFPTPQGPGNKKALASESNSPKMDMNFKNGSQTTFSQFDDSISEYGLTLNTLELRIQKLIEGENNDFPRQPEMSSFW